MEPLSLHAWLRWDAVSRLFPSGLLGGGVLEIGAGLGSMGAMLASRCGSYLGLEPDPVCWQEAQRRTGGRVLRERVEEHTGCYPLVCAFEVLEHLEDDVAALRSWRERSSCWLLLSVPLNPDRFGPADVHAGHYRRYSRESLDAALTEGGWRPRRVLSYGFPAGYALEAVRHQLAARRRSAERMEDRTEASGRWLQPSRRVAPLMWSAALPLRVLQRPFSAGELGTGLVALAERSG